MKHRVINSLVLSTCCLLANTGCRTDTIFHADFDRLPITVARHPSNGNDLGGPGNPAPPGSPEGDRLDSSNANRVLEHTPDGPSGHDNNNLRLGWTVASGATNGRIICRTETVRGGVVRGDHKIVASWLGQLDISRESWTARLMDRGRELCAARFFNGRVTLQGTNAAGAAIEQEVGDFSVGESYVAVLSLDLTTGRADIYVEQPREGGMARRVSGSLDTRLHEEWFPLTALDLVFDLGAGLPPRRPPEPKALVDDVVVAIGHH
jgi:hypothetical protein